MNLLTQPEIGRRLVALDSDEIQARAAAFLSLNSPSIMAADLTGNLKAPC